MKINLAEKITYTNRKYFFVPADTHALFLVCAILSRESYTNGFAISNPVACTTAKRSNALIRYVDSMHNR